MDFAALQPSIASALADEVRFRPVDERETQVLVPFYFPDGDGLVIHLRDAGDGTIEITDRAHTYLHLSYHVDVARLQEGRRFELLEQIRHRHGVEDRDGELIRSGIALQDVGQAVFGFVQALLEVSDLRNLEREVIQSTFKDDLGRLLADTFPEILVDYVDREHDRAGNYRIPYLLNGIPRPIAIFDIATDENATGALVIAQKHLGWRKLLLVAIEREQARLGRREVAWLSDTFDKQFSALVSNERLIVDYLRDQYALARAAMPQG